jgi:uncharacterized protein (TIGR00297 family)
VLALLIAGAARRAGSLTAGGAAAATLVGTAAVAAGWSWGMLLILYFVTSTGLSRWRRAERERLTGSVVAKGGARDARQVLANGGLFAVAATVAVVRPHDAWAAAGVGALAAAAADTWATEVGTVLGGTPRAVVGWHRVAPGSSGAVTAAGTAGMVAGAAFVAACAALLGLGSVAALAGLIGGVAGAATDTVAGAVLQTRRWCDRCGSATEQETHRCGARTRVVGGLAPVDNDVVNVLCGVVGAVVGGAVGWWAR